MKTHKILVLLFLVCFSLCSPLQAADRELFIYIWSEYIPDEVVADFTKETGIKVNISTYDSNEAMYAKIKLVGKGYDLIVPSSYFVGLMRDQGLLMPLDKKQLPNLKHIGPQFINQSFDPENSYSVPYMWGSTSLAVNTELLGTDTIRNLADLWKPELKGKLLLPNDSREVMGIGLKVLGYPINDTDPVHLEQAFRKLKELIPSVRTFDSDSPKQALLSGEVAAGVVWNGEAYIANAENPAITYLYPKEGFSLWLDSFCLPKGAKNITEAHLFLDYILQPKVAAKISSEMGYSSPNAKVSEFLQEEIRTNPIVYPGEADTARGEFLSNLDDPTSQLYEQYWMKLKEK
ncbi:MAG: extracellular solute-binding protein [Desulfobulbaceae bacterium]|nr:MAG: extracellular solute-binding protein [Desulfobulbaceae bacterium]